MNDWLLLIDYLCVVQVSRVTTSCWIYGRQSITQTSVACKVISIYLSTPIYSSAASEEYKGQVMWRPRQQPPALPRATYDNTIYKTISPSYYTHLRDHETKPNPVWRPPLGKKDEHRRKQTKRKTHSVSTVPATCTDDTLCTSATPCRLYTSPNTRD